MPITPQQAKLKISGDLDDEYKHHVKRIDKMLSEGGRTYACSLFADYRVVTMIIDGYRAAGWDVRQVADFRDGDFLEFKEWR